MEKTPIAKLLLRLSPPVMLALLIQSIYNIVDSYFVAKYSTAGLTALSIIFPIQLLMTALATGTGTGINILISRMDGTGKTENQNKLVKSGLFLGLFNYLIFAVIVLIIIRPYYIISSDIDAVKKALSDKMIVTTRLSAYDGFEYPFGFGTSLQKDIDLTETEKILSELQKRNIELVNVTIGNPYLIPHINRPFINGPEDGETGVQRAVNITSALQKKFPELKLILSALSFKGANAVDFAEKCLEKGYCSFVGFGRMTFAYPDFYCDFRKNGELDESKLCIKCGNCSKMMRAGGVAGCPVRDKEVYLPLYKKYIGV